MKNILNNLRYHDMLQWKLQLFLTYFYLSHDHDKSRISRPIFLETTIRMAKL